MDCTERTVAPSSTCALTPFTISAPADRLDEGWLPKLQATAEKISEALGYRSNAG